MQYEIEIGGRTRLVTVVRTGGGFAVTIDGRPLQVDAAPIDAHTLSLIVDGQHTYEVTVTPDPATGQFVARVGTTPIPVSVNAYRQRRRNEDQAPGSGPQRVTAPMPGKVVRVLVNAGDAVLARQPLVVVEAMKMENELRAGRDGTVADVHAREGMPVDAGMLLVVIQ